MEKLRSFLESIPLPLLVVGRDRHVIGLNTALGEMLGPDLLGRHYIAALRQPELLRGIESVLETTEVCTVRFAHNNGAQDTAFDVQISPVDVGIMLAFQDRTATDDAKGSRRDFVANVSHELRTPLTALTGFIETLQGAAKDDPVARARFLGTMERETGRMTQLVDGLLSLSRVEEESRVRPTEAVCLAALMVTTMRELEPLVRKADVRISLVGQDNPTLVAGDAAQLRQVIGNLLENALKYGAKGGDVTLTIDEPDYVSALRTDGMLLSVSDSGEGIPERHLPRLTERFYRVDNHRSRAVGGTGLGLAIVKHIVNRHRGRLDIKSVRGEGTVVSVWLPVHGSE